MLLYGSFVRIYKIFIDICAFISYTIISNPPKQLLI